MVYTGTLEYIMNTYNAEIVPKVPGLKPLQHQRKWLTGKGKPFDYTVKMDILYPSQAKKKLPAFFYSETSQTRNAHCEPASDGSHLNYYQMRGYVYIVMGHCFNPVRFITGILVILPLIIGTDWPVILLLYVP